MDSLIVKVIEDLEFNIADIEKSTARNPKFKDLKIVEVQAENFYDIFFQIFFDIPDGILIDIDLNRFRFADIYLGDLRISNGIDIAKILHEFNPSIPIAIYTSDIDIYENSIKSLPYQIQYFSKTIKEKFDTILSPFYNKVKMVNDIKLLSPKPSLEKFRLLSSIEKRAFYKGVFNEINADIYFKVVGNYSWFVECFGILAQYHGEVFDDISETQIDLQNKYNIKCVKEVKLNEILQINKEKNSIPIIFLNLTSPRALKANLIYFAAFLRVLSEESFDMLNLQIAKRLAYFFSIKEMGTQETREALTMLNSFGQFEFQKEFLKFNKLKIKHADNITNYLLPFKDLLQNKITELFIASIEETGGEDDTAWVLLENIFDYSIHFREPFSIQSLKNEGIIVVEGTSFVYIIYRNNLGNISVDIDKQF